MQNKVVIVIPLQTPEPSKLETISLIQTLSVLRDYPVIFMATNQLDVTWYVSFCMKYDKQVTVERFNWNGYEGYSTLQTQPHFYERFLSYEYMLTCHLDAFVFRDELEAWCSLNYDYVGSVIYNTDFIMKDTLFKIATTYTNPDYFGNGGFSLKKVNTFYRITLRYKLYIDFYHWQRKLRKKGFYDDLFHSVHYPKLFPDFKTAPRHLAERFGADFVKFEVSDLPFTNSDFSSLPFGIHGWIKNQQEFWMPCIRQFGHQV